MASDYFPQMNFQTIKDIENHVRGVVRDALAAVGVDDDPGIDLERPPDPAMGDYSLPCFALARQLRKAPPVIAQEVAGQIKPDGIIAEVSVLKAYVNLRLDQGTLFTVVLGQILENGPGFGSGGCGEAKRWMVEYSAPNTNKPLHLGHLRNNLLGSAIARILAFHGHEVTRVNLINDRGVHICKSMLAYQRWGEGVTPEAAGKKGDHLVGDFYVLFDRKFSEEYAAWQGTDAAREKLETWLQSKAGVAARKAREKDPAAPDPEQVFFNKAKDGYFNTDSALGQEVRGLLRRWEESDEEVLALWRTMNSWVIQGFEDSYARMGVGFDHVQRESETYKLGKVLVREGLERGIFRRLDDGAVACDLEQAGLKGQKILLRSDGTSVYMTQDLGTAMERFDRFGLDRMVYVVGDEQLYHFDVLFRVLGLLRPGLTEACHHLAYGMIRLPEGKMKSREGTVVDADDLMDQVRDLAREETLARAAEGKAHTEDITEEELAHRAEHVGMSALKYFLLKYTPRKSFEYDPRASIDFLGQTGPYCLFNYARTRSLLRKAGGAPEFSPELVRRLGSEQEAGLMAQLMQFPDMVARASDTLDPSRVAEYLFDLCKAFAFIFTDKANHPIVTCEDPALRDARLLLVASIGHVLKAGLALLGIEVLEEM